jgi:hypothetical protein
MRYIVQLATALAASLVLAGQSVAANLVVNPGFESGALSPWSCSAPGDGSCGVDTAGGGSGGVPRSGTYFFWGYENDGLGTLTQTLSTVPGATYTVSAYINSTQSSNTASIALAIGTNPPVACTVTAGTYTLCTAQFRAVTSSDTLTIQYGTQGGTGTVWVDDVSVDVLTPPAPVPALSEWGMLTLGLVLALSAGFYLRRKRS